MLNTTDLIIFDIDGTLLRTTCVDDACYARAVADVFGVLDIDPDWSVYEHCTDVAIASQIVRERLGRPCAERDFTDLRARFVELLREAHRENASLFEQIPGAKAAIAHLRARGAAVCLATGGFEESARFKLGAAAMECGDLPAAFAEDGPSREQIVRAAAKRAAAHFGNRPFDRAVSIGDGVWDVRAAASLGLPFIGIGAGERAERLRRAGAKIVLPDYADLSALTEAMASTANG